MKKSFLVVLFVMLAASMFAADLSVTLDAGLMFNKNGLYYRTPSTPDESDFTSSMSVAFDGESFGGNLEFRSEALNAPYALTAAKSNSYFFIRNYGVYVKPCQEVKISIDTGSVELLGENISWEPIHAASIFECSSAPKLIVQWDVDAHLTVYGGIDTGLESDNRKKPWTGLSALASYEVFGLGKFIAKYENLTNEWGLWDAGLAFQLLALDTQDVYAGYSLILPATEFKPLQHRFEVFYGINFEALSLSFFNSLEIKTLDTTSIGDRFAFKATYYWNNITPSLAINYYYNFHSATHAWGEPDTDVSDCSLIDIDPRVAFAFGQGTLSTGARITIDLKANGYKWYIPLGITVNF